MTDSRRFDSGHTLGEWLDAAVPVPERESSEPGLRQGILAGAEQRIRSRRRHMALSAAAGVALVVTLGVGHWMGPSRQAAIQFRVAPGTNNMGRVGAYVAPTGDTPLDLKFTEGSQVELKPGARARVAATTARGATVLLETGRASVDVVHHDRADWTIMAGPYSVRVHGTSFTVEFDAKTQLFELVMRSGVVSVEGPGISQPLEIRGAQRFVHHAGLSADATEVARQSEPQAPSFAEQVPSASPEVFSKYSPGAASNPSLVGAASPTWETLVRRGEYSAILHDAERQGIPHVLSTARAAEILALGNAARFSGRVDIGAEAYKAIRQRFARSAVAASAAFLMGRLMEPGSPGEARRWYERYEQEAPKGPLVAEAVGRRLLLTQSTGNRVEVQRLAEDYVRRFPDGPYAGVARKIVTP